MNEPVCYDLGFRREGDQPCWFVLDDEGNEMVKFSGHDGPFICSNQELEAIAWIRSRNAEVNYLPSYHHYNRQHSDTIMSMFAF